MAVGRSRAAAGHISEEMVAAARVVQALSLSVGMVLSAIGVATGDPLAIIVVPTALLAASLVVISVTDRWRSLAVAASGWAGVGVWLVVLPQAHAEAMLGPLLMLAVCLSIAVGPGRLWSWIVRDFCGAVEPSASDGWIEEVRR